MAILGGRRKEARPARRVGWGEPSKVGSKIPRGRHMMDPAEVSKLFHQLEAYRNFNNTYQICRYLWDANLCLPPIWLTPLPMDSASRLLNPVIASYWMNQRPGKQYWSIGFEDRQQWHLFGCERSYLVMRWRLSTKCASRPQGRQGCAGRCLSPFLYISSVRCPIHHYIAASF